MKKQVVVAAVAPLTPVRAQVEFQSGDLVRSIDTNHLIGDYVVVSNLYEIGRGVRRHQVRIGHTVQMENGDTEFKTHDVDPSAIKHCCQDSRTGASIPHDFAAYMGEGPALPPGEPHLKLYDPNAGDEQVLNGARLSRDIFYAEMGFTADRPAKAAKKPATKKPIKKAKKKPAPKKSAKKKAKKLTPA